LGKRIQNRKIEIPFFPCFLQTFICKDF
jgi:hypothetical protein